MAEKNKYTGLPGQPYSHPRRQVQDISDMKRGDHVMFQRAVYEHHGIVTAVDESSGAFDCIEYHKKSKEDGIKIQEQRHILSEKNAGSVHVVKYKEGECLPADEVIRNAENMLGIKEYNLVLKNCESMALECKVGKEKAKSEQINNVFSFGALEVFPKVVEARRWKLIEKALQSSAGDGLEWLDHYIEMFSGSTWLLIATAIEAGISVYKVVKFLWQYSKGQITGKRCIAMIIQQIVLIAVELACAYGGLGIGGLVGRPLLGGFLGGVVGRYAAMRLCDYVLAGLLEKLDGDLDFEKKVKVEDEMNKEKQGGRRTNCGG